MIREPTIEFNIEVKGFINVSYDEKQCDSEDDVTDIKNEAKKHRLERVIKSLNALEIDILSYELC